MVQKPVAIGTRAQLFVDDYLVAASDGVTEQLHPMTQLPTPVLKAETIWERPEIGGLWGPVTVHRDPDEGLLRMWYTSYGAFPAYGQQQGPLYKCYATSQDGLHWDRPNLGLSEYEGSTANNILPGWTASPGHGMMDCAEMAGIEPPEVRYKSALWLGNDEDGLGGHGVSFSADGLHWQAYEHNPVTRGRQRGDVSSVAKLFDGAAPEGPAGFPTAKYALFPKVQVPLGRWQRRSFAVCTSEDDAEGLPFTKWTEPMLAFAADRRDDDMAEERLAAAKPILLYDHPDDHRCEFYGVMVFRTGDVFLGLIWVYDAAFDIGRIGGGNEYAIVDVQLATSRDLIHWHRAGDRQPVISRGEPGTFDSHMIFYHSMPVAVGDEWWVYYVGFNEGHAARLCYDETMRQQYWADVRAGKRHFPAVGLAKVRRDGCISRDAGPAGGTLTTRLLQPGGSQLEVNATVPDGGAITVEVQDEQGKPLPEFTAADCTPLTGDSLRHQVRWGERRGDDRWQERPVRLQYQLRPSSGGTSLYGFRFAA